MKTTLSFLFAGILAFSINAQQLQWGIAFGGTGFDMIQAIEVDADNNTYVVGQFGSLGTDFDPSSGTELIDVNGGYDMFLAKYDPSGGLMYVVPIQGPQFKNVND
ncbi:MAG: hypothetical protein HRT74_13290, partial [Flavobacteriales bacterium]|nr:hypothetical protein [Flavobacteriales bacterium]